MLKKYICILLVLALMGMAAATAREEMASIPGGRLTGILRYGDSLLLADGYHKILWAFDGEAVTRYAALQTIDGPGGEPLGGFFDDLIDSSLFRAPYAMVPFLEGLAVSDTKNHVVRFLFEGEVYTIFGNGQQGHADGEAKSAAFSEPTGLAVDDAGNLYIADTGNNAIRVATSEGEVSTLAYEGDALLRPMGICWQDGALYVADSGNHRIVRIKNGKLSAVAGYTDEHTIASGGYADGAAEQAQFAYPRNVAITATGTLLVADTGNGAVRKISRGEVSTLTKREDASLEMFPLSPEGLYVEGDYLYVSDAVTGILQRMEWK